MTGEDNVCNHGSIVALPISQLKVDSDSTHQHYGKSSLPHSLCNGYSTLDEEVRANGLVGKDSKNNLIKDEPTTTMNCASECKTCASNYNPSLQGGDISPPAPVGLLDTLAMEQCPVLCGEGEGEDGVSDHQGDSGFENGLVRMESQEDQNDISPPNGEYL